VQDAKESGVLSSILETLNEKKDAKGNVSKHTGSENIGKGQADQKSQLPTVTP
jgi:hypothetical protein